MFFVSCSAFSWGGNINVKCGGWMRYRCVGMSYGGGGEI
jgi:hypothetical protein